MRLFVAAWPSEAVLDVIEALPRPDVPGLRWSGRSHWHVTVRFLGDTDPDAVAAALAAAPLPGPVDAVVGPRTGRFGRRVLHVPVSGLDDVAAAVVRATAHLGRPPDDRPFHGHLTLGRPIGRARPPLETVAGAPLAARWTVTDLCLVESRPGPSGSTYRTVATLPLGR